MKNLSKIKLPSILFVLLLSLFTTDSFAQTDEKQLSLQFASDLKNAQYHELFIMLDSSVAKQYGENNLSATCQAIITKLGTIEDYSFINEENTNGMMLTSTKCRFKSITLNLQLAFNKSLKVIGFHFTSGDESAAYIRPVYDSAKLYTEKEITVTTGMYKLPGILTVPRHVKNPPVMILVHGSGPGDRDESVGPNKTFRDLAVGLAARGIATIRYDKRTKVYGKLSSDNMQDFTVKEETINDALSAVNMVGSLSKLNIDSGAAGIQMLGLDSNRIYLLGHSLGAMLAPRIAHANKKIKGIIVMAGPSRPFEDVAIEQFKYQASLDTIAGDKTKQATEKEIKKMELAKSADLNTDTPDSLLPFNSPASYWIDLNNYNQVKVAAALTIPVLIIQGENDCQVSMTDFNLWKEKLGSQKNVTFKSYPKLNHLFMVCESKSTGADYGKPSNVPVYVINDIAAWVGANKK